VIIDHITSQTALVLPIADIIRKCHAKGALVLVDAAHSPGAIDVNIESYGADWYVANLHKWAFAPRSCGVLWADPRHHAALHPTVISWGLDHGLAAEFDLLGTRDPAPFLAAPFALNLLEEWGGATLRAHNRRSALAAADYITSEFGTAYSTPHSMVGPMVNVGVGERFGTTKDEADSLRRRLFERHSVEVPVFPGEGGVRLRVSMQIYNEHADVERLVAALRGEAP
jgi:isopenicillin-N epimerase